MSRKGILTIAVVIDVAVNTRTAGPVSAKALATRHKPLPRHLEPVLQALVHSGIVKGIRGPRSGYMLGREHRRISAENILRAAGSAEEAGEPPLPSSLLVVNNVVRPALAEAERSFSAALARISVEDMAQRAKALK